ncbi:hypothetical protein OsJ_24152 [Oryza sativa Japonica Group]|uniref:Uncharacterized protein n=1 Tax=Oryza sativa subsp. japonica TaxID=39947 RepID=B9FX38_ORYSJ|nr:hypothetical protein OsJ_24152 [Oryza sativa Japonica Group]
MAAAPITLLVLSLLLLAVAAATAATFPTTVNAYTPATGVADAGAAAGEAAGGQRRLEHRRRRRGGHGRGLCGLGGGEHRRLYTGGRLGHTMDKCVSTCILGLGAAEAYLAALQPLPVEDRLHSIHDGLSALFRDGSDVPAAYSTGCPAGSIRNVDEESVVATFRNVYAVLDLLEQDLSQVYSSATPSTTTPAKPEATAPVGMAEGALEKECDDAAKPQTSTPTLEAKAYENAAGAPAAATAAKESSTPATATPVAQAYDNAGAGAAKEEPAAAAAKESSKDNYGGASQ